MKKPTIIMAAAALLSVPAPGTAQVYEHVPGGIGLTANHYPDQGYGPGIGLARPVASIGFHTGGGVSFGFGLGFGVGFGVGDPGYGGYLYNAHPFTLQPLHHCWNHIWFGPFQYCDPYYGRGWFDPWWQPVVFVPSPRFHFGWYSHGWYSPFRHDPWYDRWAYRGWDPYWGHPGYRTVYYDRGYVYDRGYARTRVASRSPLFGPRYKEDPRPHVYVTDNGPERPVSKAVPRGDRTGRPALGTDGAQPAAGRRGRDARTVPETRTARPRVKETPETGRGASPATSAQPRTPRTRAGGMVVTPGSSVRTSRPDTRREDTGTASRPRSSRPAVVTPVPTRNAKPSAGRATPSRGRVATPQASRATPPKVRARPDASPTRRVTPSRPTTPKRVRPAPARTTSKAPKVRSAPSRARSAPPKASSAPARRSPPKSSPPKRGAPPRRGK